jgi:YHS domain-containing protein
LAPALALAGDGAQWNSDEHGVVLGGYDVVAYHTQGQPVRGRSAFAARHEGGTFYFSSQENLAAFEKQPGQYAPRFGGFCAFGVAANKAKVPVDPATFKIQNGELLLFFNDMYEGKKVNTKPMWEQDPDKLYREATATWPTLE